MLNDISCSPSWKHSGDRAQIPGPTLEQLITVRTRSCDPRNDENGPFDTRRCQRFDTCEPGCEGPPNVQRRRTTTSKLVAVGGRPVSNFALTTAKRSPSRATVVGTSKSGLVKTCSTIAEVRSGVSLSSVTWFMKFWTAHRRSASSRIPSTVGRSTPAIVALAPVRGLTVYTVASPLWATSSLLPFAVAAIPLSLTNGPDRCAGGPVTPRVN